MELADSLTGTACDPKKWSSVTRTLLGQSLSHHRRRASSGPSNLGESIKKLLPNRSTFFPTNTPAVAGFGYGASVRKPDDEPPPTNDVKQAASEEPIEIQGEHVSSQEQLPVEDAEIEAENQGGSNPAATDKPTASRQAGEALLSPTNTTASGKLRRSTSESSLYLRRTKTSSSAAYYDDTSLFADVSSQVNSRFKAIQDTWQDSAFAKMPRMPSVSLAKGLPFDWMSNDSHSHTSREVCRDTTVNTKTSDSVASTGIDDESSSRRAHPIMHRATLKLRGGVLVMGGKSFTNLYSLWWHGGNYPNSHSRMLCLSYFW